MAKVSRASHVHGEGESVSSFEETGLNRPDETLSPQATEGYFLPPENARHIQVIPESNDNGTLIFSAEVSTNTSGDIPTTVFRGKTKVGAATLRFTDETPVDLSDPVPLLWIQGYMGPEKVYEDARHAATQEGRRSITIGRAGWQSPSVITSRKHLLHPETITHQSPWAVIKALDLDEVDVVAHSMGGPISVEMALRRHEKIRQLTLLGSAGLTGHTPFTLASRMPYAIAEIKRGLPEMRKRYGLIGALSILDYFYKNPLRPIAEALNVANSDIRELLPKLGSLGVRTAVGAFNQDCFFDEKVMREQVADKVDVFEEIHANLAGHIAPQLEPEHVVKRVLEMSERALATAA